MKRTMFFAAGFAISASLAAANVVYADGAKVDEVKVTAEIEDATGSNALEYWPSIETDLANAITHFAKDRLDDDGLDLSVQIADISMSGSGMLTGEGEFNHLEGWVYFYDELKDAPVHQEKIIIDAMSGEVDPGEYVVFAPDVPAFYAALLLGFADLTIEELDQIPTAETAGEENRSQN